MNNCSSSPCPPLISDLLTPKVLWHQTDGYVTLRIMLMDVDDYFLRVDEDHLRFSTIINDRPYYLCIYLFGSIIPAKCIHRNFHREIKVTIPKAHKFISWPRLSIRKENNPSILVDPDKITDENDLEAKTVVKREWNDWQEYKRQNNIFNIPPASHSSEDDESDDEATDALIDRMDMY